MKNSPKFHSSGLFILISINVGDDALENFYCATERNSEKTKKISPLEVNAKVVDDRKLRTFEASVAFFFLSVNTSFTKLAKTYDSCDRWREAMFGLVEGD